MLNFNWLYLTAQWNLLYVEKQSNHFQGAGPCDLDLWPSGSINNRDHLLIMPNHPGKFFGLLCSYNFQHVGPWNLIICSEGPKCMRIYLQKMSKYQVFNLCVCVFLSYWFYQQNWATDLIIPGIELCYIVFRWHTRT